MKYILCDQFYTSFLRTEKQCGTVTQALNPHTGLKSGSSILGSLLNLFRSWFSSVKWESTNYCIWFIQLFWGFNEVMHLMYLGSYLGLRKCLVNLNSMFLVGKELSFVYLHQVKTKLLIVVESFFKVLYSAVFIDKMSKRESDKLLHFKL